MAGMLRQVELPQCAALRRVPGQRHPALGTRAGSRTPAVLGLLSLRVSQGVQLFCPRSLQVAHASPTALPPVVLGEA